MWWVSLVRVSNSELKLWQLNSRIGWNQIWLQKQAKTWFSPISHVQCQMMCMCTGALQLGHDLSEEFEAEGECWREPNLQLHAQHKVWLPPMSHLQLSQINATLQAFLGSLSLSFTEWPNTVFSVNQIVSYNWLEANGIWVAPYLVIQLIGSYKQDRWYHYLEYVNGVDK